MLPLLTLIAFNLVKVHSSGSPELTIVSASASAEGGPGFDAAQAIDGDETTRWGTGPGDGDDVTFTADLGTNLIVDEVEIQWETASASAYELQGSDDGITFSTLATRSGLTGARTDSISLDLGGFRFLRMQGVTRDNIQFGYSIFEFRVFGIASMAPSMAPSISTAPSMAPSISMAPSMAPSMTVNDGEEEDTCFSFRFDFIFCILRLVVSFFRDIFS